MGIYINNKQTKIITIRTRSKELALHIRNTRSRKVTDTTEQQNAQIYRNYLFTCIINYLPSVQATAGNDSFFGLEDLYF